MASQDYSEEWRKALTERDMAVRAIADFLAVLNKPQGSGADADPIALVSIQKDGAFTDGFTRIQAGEFPEFDKLREVVSQFRPKALR